ncbi:MAG: shikimate kinase [bacterium]|nr:shikimate kinase [bacterium]
MRLAIKHNAAQKKSRHRRELLLSKLGDRSIILVGLMGAGKTVIGRMLAKRLKLPFVDADQEIEAAAGMSIKDIFAEHGEAYFRDGERKVIKRILDNGPQILATGGGAMINKQTRDAITKCGITLWLKADLDILMERVSRKNTRPLLQTDDPRSVMKKLLDERYPIYGLSDVSVVSRNVQKRTIVTEAVVNLCEFLCHENDPGTHSSHKNKPKKQKPKRP